MRNTVVFMALVALLAGCDATTLGADDLGGLAGDGGGGGLPDSGGQDLTLTVDLAGSDGGPLAGRPYTMNLHVPAGYDSSTATPLVILLHGYTATGAEQEAYFQLTKVSDEKTFLYVYPDGTQENSAAHYRFWNATDACCNFYGSDVDDVAYVNAIIDDMQAKFNVDPKRIFITGHSNGGFMSNRMACDAPRVAAIAELAGAMWKDTSKCKPAGPVSVLHVHGTADAVINYNGGSNLGHDYPGAKETVGDWATMNGCTGTLTSLNTTYDLDSGIIGAETTPEAYTGCPVGGAVELWSINGGSHIPAFVQPDWPEKLWGWLSAHPKP